MSERAPVLTVDDFTALFKEDRELQLFLTLAIKRALVLYQERLDKARKHE